MPSPDPRSLPSVSELQKSLPGIPANLSVGEIRRVLDRYRQAMLAGENIDLSRIAAEVTSAVDSLRQPSLRRVINATGVVLHTNLGRAPLAQFHPIAGYSNLELDLETGKRGKRDTHTAILLERLLHRPAVLVNNNAAAVYLVLHELAAGSEVIVSRGELIEIGDGFRIPEIMARSGAILREVGTTNRTHLDDYRRALSDRTRLIMRVHPSNFHLSGFVSRPSLSGLASLAAENDIPLYEDLGSGCLVDLSPAGISEPMVGDSLRAGVNVVSFSCDKLLGGPQSGIIAGDAPLVQRIRTNFMYRALRVDKLIVECLEGVLRAMLFENWQEIPSLAAVFAPLEVLQERAHRVAGSLGGEVREASSPIGGGSTPDQSLPTWVVELAVAHPDRFLKELRQASVPVIARISDDRVVLDMRTVADDEIEHLISGVSPHTTKPADRPQT